MKKVGKVEAAMLPTPLHRLDNVSNDLGINVYIKRDDMTGIGMGGNKLRKLDYIVYQALEEGCTTLLTYGGPQTNHGRLTAAVACKFGMKSIIMAYGKKEKKMSGNLVLDRLMGTEVAFIDTTEIKKKAEGKTFEETKELYREKKEFATNAMIKKYEEQGEKVYPIQIGGHSKEGLLGYFNCVKEILEQSKQMGVQFDYVIVGNGSGGTLGGLLLGKKFYNAPFKIISANVSETKEGTIKRMIKFCNKTAKYYDMGIRVSTDDFISNNDYIGEGYNEPDRETREAIYYLASKEGIFTDPCYTGKSFNALLGLARKGMFKKDEKILYIHTGGTPGIWSENHKDAFDGDLWYDILEF